MEGWSLTPQYLEGVLQQESGTVLLPLRSCNCHRLIFQSVKSAGPQQPYWKIKTNKLKFFQGLTFKDEPSPNSGSCTKWNFDREAIFLE